MYSCVCGSLLCHMRDKWSLNQKPFKRIVNFIFYSILGMLHSVPNLTEHMAAKRYSFETLDMHFDYSVSNIYFNCIEQLFCLNHPHLSDCDVNCHKKCEKLTANLCGVNQKLIVEALSSVRRGKIISICKMHFAIYYYYSSAKALERCSERISVRN